VSVKTFILKCTGVTA